MNILTNILISAVIALVSFAGAYKYLPLNWLDTAQQSHTFGATITTIQGSDTLSASRTTINNNFANLNSSKIEATQTTLNSLTSASSLATIGTITSGNWNGSIIGATWGGTGSSTLSQYSLLLGSSTNPIGIVQGLGASGQFLTSNGAGAPPTWQAAAINQAANYNWTGNHNFTGSTYIKTLFASSTIVINGVTSNFPSSQGASSTMLMNDGAGNLTYEQPAYRILYTSTGPQGNGTNLITIPANTLVGLNKIKINWSGISTGGAGDGFFSVAIGSGSATTTIVTLTNDSGSGYVIVSPQSATSQEFSGVNAKSAIGSIAPNVTAYTAANKIYILFTATNNSGTAIIYNEIVTLITQ